MDLDYRDKSPTDEFNYLLVLHSGRFAAQLHLILFLTLSIPRLCKLGVCVRNSRSSIFKKALPVIAVCVVNRTTPFL